MAKHKSAISLHPSPTLLAAQRSFLNPKGTCSTDSDVFCCELSPNGSLVAGSLSDGSVMIFETQSNSLVYKLPLPSFQESYPATAVKFRPIDTDGLQNIVLVAYSSGHVHQWHVSTGKSLNFTNEKRMTLAAAYSCDASTYTTSGSDCKLLVYDTPTGDCKRIMEASSSLTLMDGHMNRVFALRYHPYDPNVLISGGWDNTVQYWDIRTDQAIRKLSGPHICGDSLDIEPNTLNIATGSWRYATPLEVWDFHSGNLISPLHCCTGTKLYATCWLSERYLLIGGSQRHCASIIDTHTDKIVSDMKDVSAGVYSVNFNRATKTTAIASGNKIHLCSSHFSSNNSSINKSPAATFITELDRS